MKITTILMMLKRSVVLLSTFFSVLLIYSCQEGGLIPTISDQITAEYLQNREDLQIYLDHEQVLRVKGKPGVPILIGSNNLPFYEECFILYIASGIGSQGLVSRAIIKLDGLEVLNASDFSNSSKQYEFEVCNLSSQSQLEVEVIGMPGSYVDIWMEGKKKNIGSVKDIDDNVYKTVKIGNQWWMAENLKTTRYNDGTPLENVTGNLEWVQTTVGAYCWFDNDINLKDLFGAYYNGFAANDERNVCPTGWHVPNYNEALELQTYLGGRNLAGGKLKEIGYASWIPPNEGATNETGFSALAVGFRNGAYGQFGSTGYLTMFCLDTDLTPPLWNIGLYNYEAGMDLANNYFTDGYSIRCIKDN